MCGVVNVTHVERRGHDQVGSAWKIQPRRSTRVYVFVYILRVRGRMLELTGNGGTSWLVGVSWPVPHKKQNCPFGGVWCRQGVREGGSSVVVSRPALLNNESWLNRAPCRNLGFAFSPEVKLGQGLACAFPSLPLLEAIVHVPIAGHFSLSNEGLEWPCTWRIRGQRTHNGHFFRCHDTSFPPSLNRNYFYYYR